MDNRKVLSFPDFACRKSTMLLRHVQKAKIYKANSTGKHLDHGLCRSLHGKQFYTKNTVLINFITTGLVICTQTREGLLEYMQENVLLEQSALGTFALSIAVMSQKLLISKNY